MKLGDKEFIEGITALDDEMKMLLVLTTMTCRAAIHGTTLAPEQISDTVQRLASCYRLTIIKGFIEEVIWLGKRPAEVIRELGPFGRSSLLAHAKICEQLAAEIDIAKNLFEASLRSEPKKGKTDAV